MSGLRLLQRQTGNRKERSRLIFGTPFFNLLLLNSKAFKSLRGFFCEVLMYIVLIINYFTNNIIAFKLHLKC